MPRKKGIFAVLDCSLCDMESAQKIRKMGLEAFGAWVNLLVHVRLHGTPDGEWFYIDKTTLLNATRAKDKRQFNRVMNRLQSDFGTTQDPSTWLRWDQAEAKIVIPNFLKYQRLLRYNRQLGGDTGRDVGIKNGGESIESIKSNLFTNVNKLLLDEKKAKNSEPDFRFPERLSDWVHDHCSRLVEKVGPDVYKWANRWARSKPKDVDYIKAACLYFERNLGSVEKEHFYAQAADCINRRWEGMLAVEKEITGKNIDAFFGTLEKLANGQA